MVDGRARDQRAYLSRRGFLLEPIFDIYIYISILIIFVVFVCWVFCILWFLFRVFVLYLD